MPFDPRIDPSVDPDRVLSVAALYGAGTQDDIDILRQMGLIAPLRCADGPLTLSLR